jgi:long-subunit fatty acid transport protein
MVGTRTTAILLSIVACAAASGPRLARAGGFEYGTDNGALAAARGGAVTARPTIFAIYSNVAGIADVPRLDVMLNANLVFRDLSFQREGSAVAEDTTPLFPGPMLALHLRLSDDVALGLGVHGPAAVGEGHFDHGDLEAPGTTRYMMTDMSFIYAIPTVALAFRLPGLEGFRLGIAFQPCMARARLSVYANALAPDETLFDVRADADVMDWFVPAVQIGFLQRLGRRVEVGAQVRLTDSVSAEGDVWPTGFPYHDELREQYAPSRGRIDVPLPFATVRAGLRYRHPRLGRADEENGARVPPHRAELFDVELDVVYESNSDFDEFVVVPLEPVHVPIVDTIEVDALPVRQLWSDTVNVRLGGTLNLLGGDLSLSAGVFWQSAAADDAYLHVVFPAWTSVGLSAGATYRYRWFEVGLGYVHIFMPDRTVSEEEGRVFALRATPDGGTFDGPAVNAGTFRASYDILVVSLAARLDPRPRRAARR